MKNKLLVVGALLGVSFIAHAEDDGFHIAIEPQVGLEVALPGKMQVEGDKAAMFEVGGGAHIGCLFNFHIDSHIYITPGVSIFTNTYSMKEKLVKEIDERMDYAMYYKSGFRIPLYVGYHWKITSDKGFSLFTGPEFQYVFSGKESVRINNSKITNSLYGKDREFRRCCENWILGGKFDVNHITISVSYGFGMINLIRLDKTSFYENRVNVEVGYKF